MTAAGEYLDAIRATVKRDAAVFLSYRFRFVSQVATILLTMTMFYYISKIVRPGVVGPHGQYFAFVVVGIVSLAVPPPRSALPRSSAWSCSRARSSAS